MSHDPVNHPQHYTSHPSGVECIQVTEHMGFNLGNAVKYIWRADLKHDAIQDLEKAAWYLQREIERRRAESVQLDIALDESPLMQHMLKVGKALHANFAAALETPRKIDSVIVEGEGDEASAPPIPVSDETLAAMAKNCVRLAQHLIDADARRTVAHRHALKLGENVAAYVRTNFVELDSQVLSEWAAAQAADNESRS